MPENLDFIKEETGILRKKDNEDEYEFEGIASSYGNEDCYGDVFVEGSLKNACGKPITIMLNHSWSVKDIIGKGVLEEDGDKVLIKGNFTKGIEAADNIAKLKNDGVPLKLSIGGRIKKWELKKENDKFIRYIQEAEIFETSIVFRGANPVAQITKSEEQKDLINKTNNLIDVLIKKYGGK